MTPAERKRLAEIERNISTDRAEECISLRDALTLRDFARRLDAAEEFRDVFLTDRAADDDGARDALLISEAGKMAARECYELTCKATVPLSNFDAQNRARFAALNMHELAKAIMGSIRERFQFDVPGGPTLSQQVAQECCETADAAVRIRYGHGIADAIRRRFGLEQPEPKCARCNGHKTLGYRCGSAEDARRDPEGELRNCPVCHGTGVAP